MSLQSAGANCGTESIDLLCFYPTETLTFLFTDIEGSTALLRRLGEDAYAVVLADHHLPIRSWLAGHGGTRSVPKVTAFSRCSRRRAPARRR